MTERQGQDAVDYLAPGEAAARLRVSVKTLTRMADKQQVDFIRLPSGHRRYLATSIDSFTNAPAEVTR
ncbi:MerR family transcriptional regulator [Agrococcus pavilionensis]|nr:MerR family DNA-binding transcriptional regulator [Agrococcus pavilionensis]